MERGRTNYLRLIGADHRALFEATEKEAPGFAFVVRSMTIDFLKPARMDDVLDIVTEPEEVKGASGILRQRVMRGDELLVEARVRFAFISGGRARPIPKPLRIAMKADQDLLAPGGPSWRQIIVGRGWPVAPDKTPSTAAEFWCRRIGRLNVRAIYMTWSKHDREGPRGYHHGNLKRGAPSRGARADRAEGTGRLHFCRSGALGGREPGGAVSAFSRPR